MKKFILVLLLVVCFCSGCSVINGVKKTKRNTPEELLVKYADAYMSGDLTKLKDVLPKFYYDAMAISYGANDILQSPADNKKIYGDGYSITFSLVDQKLLETDELDRINKNIQGTQFYKTKQTANECYKLKTTINITGSISSKSGNSNFYYCDFDGTWSIIPD